MIEEAELKLRENLWEQGYWEVPDGLDTSNFDFDWRPFKFDKPFIHQFGTQHQKTGGPKFIVPNNQGIKYQDSQRAIRLPNKEDRCWRPLITNATIDFSWHPDDTEPPFIYVFGNQWYNSGTMPTYQYRVKGATTKKYMTDVSATLLPNHEDRNWRPLKANIEFDYSWVPHPHDPPFIYVFGNQWHISEKMPTVEYRVKDATDRKYLCAPIAKFKTEQYSYEDSLFDKVMDAVLETNYTHFGTNKLNYDELIPTDNQYLQIFDNTDAIVPKEVKNYVYDKLSDYPHIKHHTLGFKNTPLDIIFLSNGEEKAEENYYHLLDIVKGLPNKIIGLKGIQGRVASQHEAAKQSSTPWYFLINGKCKINPDFDFSWQPDRMQSGRHYIFTATNPLNGLEYGHMAVVANNKRLTLQTTGSGLDFTLDSPHESIKLNSGIGVFNSSKWDTWRTAFREVIKLKHSVETTGSQASADRLAIWLTKAEGVFAQTCLQGAKDAVFYYESVAGDFEKLKLSYDWLWLKQHYNQRS